MLKDMLKSVASRGAPAADDDAVHIPLRLQVALATCLFGAILLCNTTIRVGVSLQARCDFFAARYALPLATSVGDVTFFVENATGAVIPTSELVANIDSLRADLVSLGAAAEEGAVRPACLDPPTPLGIPSHTPTALLAPCLAC